MEDMVVLGLDLDLLRHQHNPPRRDARTGTSRTVRNTPSWCPHRRVHLRQRGHYLERGERIPRRCRRSDRQDHQSCRQGGRRHEDCS